MTADCTTAETDELTSRQHAAVHRCVCQPNSRRYSNNSIIGGGGVGDCIHDSSCNHAGRVTTASAGAVIPVVDAAYIVSAFWQFLLNPRPYLSFSFTRTHYLRCPVVLFLFSSLSASRRSIHVRSCRWSWLDLARTVARQSLDDAARSIHTLPARSLLPSVIDFYISQMLPAPRA